MLTASFCCFHGVSPEAERRLWEAGVLDWRDARRAGRVFSERRHAELVRQIEEALVALEAGLWDYFLSRLPAEHRVRVLPHVEDVTGWVDVETTGLEARASVTTIALLTRDRVRVFVEGEDLPEFLREVARCRLVVTYNGLRFDVPAIERRFGLRVHAPHLDLLAPLAAAGYRGGLKACERQAGFPRAGEAVDGAQAVELWRRWVDGGDAAALEALVLYNAQDACNLRRLCGMLYRRSMAAYPLRVASPVSRSLTIE